MFKEKVNAWTHGRTHARPDGHATDNGPLHKLAGLRPVELKTSYRPVPYEVVEKKGPMLTVELMDTG